MSGADIGLVGDSGNPLAIFTSEGDAYVWATCLSGPTQWIMVGLDDTQHISKRDKEKQESIETKADLIKRTAAGASEPVLGWTNFYTTKTPSLSPPSFGITEDRSMTFIAGKMFTGVKTSLPSTPFNLVAAQPVTQV